MFLDCFESIQKSLNEHAKDGLFVIIIPMVYINTHGPILLCKILPLDDKLLQKGLLSNIFCTKEDKREKGRKTNKSNNENNISL